MSYLSNTEPIRFQCRHIFTDGRRCKNPTLRSPQTDENPGGHENFCYFHHTTRGAASRVPHPRRASRGRVGSAFTLPQLEDRSAIQLAIGQVLQKIAANDIDPRRAGLLLYGLQIASLNLPKLNPKEDSEEDDTAGIVDEITHHPTLGTLARPAELHSTEPKGTAQRLLEELTRNDEEEDKAEPTAESTLPTIQATADTTPRQHTRSTHHRTRPNPLRLKNLYKNCREGRHHTTFHPAT